tara:strand:+ start:23234 stop:23680 length:447 start_codon:yes stop_codon:yes gene_type:complete
MNIAKIKRRKRLLIIFLAFIALSISGFLVLNASRDSLIYFYSPTEILEKSDIKGKTIRIGGLVEEKSIVYLYSSKLQFTVTDGTNKIVVFYEGILPDLFREGQGVICEGKINLEGAFVAERILAKHDEKYMPPEVADKLKESGQWKGE